MRKLDVHLISFKRRGEPAYNMLHTGQWVSLEQYEALQRFLKEHETQPVEGAEDLA